MPAAAVRELLDAEGIPLLVRMSTRSNSSDPAQHVETLERTLTELSSTFGDGVVRVAVEVRSKSWELNEGLSFLAGAAPVAATFEASHAARLTLLTQRTHWGANVSLDRVLTALASQPSGAPPSSVRLSMDPSPWLGGPSRQQADTEYDLLQHVDHLDLDAGWSQWPYDPYWTTVHACLRQLRESPAHVSLPAAVLLDRKPTRLDAGERAGPLTGQGAGAGEAAASAAPEAGSEALFVRQLRAVHAAAQASDTLAAEQLPYDAPQAATRRATFPWEAAAAAASAAAAQDPAAAGFAPPAPPHAPPKLPPRLRVVDHRGKGPSPQPAPADAASTVVDGLLLDRSKALDAAQAELDLLRLLREEQRELSRQLAELTARVEQAEARAQAAETRAAGAAAEEPSGSATAEGGSVGLGHLGGIIRMPRS